MKPCSVPTCGNQTKRKKYCDLHYKRWKRHGSPLGTAYTRTKKCSIRGCTCEATRGFRKDRKPLCFKHYGRWLRHGDPKKLLIREYGSGHINKNGYKLITVNGRKILEHRFVMEQRLGRKLKRDETVHHKNGRRLDNFDSNLELWVSSQPSGQRVGDIIRWARALLKRYEREENRHS